MVNAIEALSGPEGRVAIMASLHAEAGLRLAMLQVRDTGRGMSQSELDKAFTDFHTTKADGTGLGLSVVRRLVSDAEGVLRVETAPGAGTTFTVEIPAA